MSHLSPPHDCPVCQAAIDTGKTSYADDDGDIFAYLSCNNCKTVWEETYTFASFKITTKGTIPTE